MRNVAPNRDELDANYFAPNAATHAENKHYLLSSKGNRQDIPLPRTCPQFNGVDNQISFSEIGNNGGRTMGCQIYLTSAALQTIFTHNGTDVLSIDQANQQITLQTWNGSNYSSSLIDINQNGKSIPLNTWFSLIHTGAGQPNLDLIYIDGIQAGSLQSVAASSYFYWDSIIPTESIRMYELFDYKDGTAWDAASVLKMSQLNYRLFATVEFLPQLRWHLEEGAGAAVYDIGGGLFHNNGTIAGDLTNFWYQGADVPFNYANKVGYGKNVTYETAEGDYPNLSVASLFYHEVIQNIFGKIDALLFTPNTDVTPHSILVNNTHLNFSLILLELEFYIPSANTNSNGIRIRDNLGPGFPDINYTTPALDTWIKVSEEVYATGSGFHLSHYKNGVAAFAGAGSQTDDIIYVTNIKVTVLGTIPAISPTTDALGNPLTNPGEVRQLAKVKNVNVGVLDGISSIQFSPFPVGFTFTFEGTATSVAIDGTGLLTAGAGDIYDLRILDGGTLVNHYSFNEGQGDTVFDLVGSNNGTWTGHTNPNQWGKSDDTIDYFLLNNLKINPTNDGLEQASPSSGFINTGSNIDFNPLGALGEGVPTNYSFGDSPSVNQFFNNVTRKPSNFDFIFYNNPLSQEGLRRINEYAQYEVIDSNIVFPFTLPFNL